MGKWLGLAVGPLIAIPLIAAALPASFEVSFRPGSRDGVGRFVGGPEMRVLAAHAGKLFAGNGYWEDMPGPEGRQGSQILVLDAPNAGWRVDHDFAGRCPTADPGIWPSQLSPKPGLPAMRMASRWRRRFRC